MVLLHYKQLCMRAMNFHNRKMLSLGWKRSIRYGLSTACAYLYYTYTKYMTIYSRLMIAIAASAAAEKQFNTPNRCNVFPPTVHKSENEMGLRCDINIYMQVIDAI